MPTKPQTDIVLYRPPIYYLKQANTEWGKSLSGWLEKAKDAGSAIYEPMKSLGADLGNALPFLHGTPKDVAALPDPFANKQPANTNRLKNPPRVLPNTDYIKSPHQGEAGAQTFKHPTYYKEIDSKGNKQLEAALQAQGLKPIQEGSTIYSGTMNPHVLSQGGQSVLQGASDVTPGWFKKNVVGKIPLVGGLDKKKRAEQAKENIKANITRDIENLDPIQKYVFGSQGYMKKLHGDAMNLYQQAQILEANGDKKGAQRLMNQYRVVYEAYNAAAPELDKRYEPWRTHLVGMGGPAAVLGMLMLMFGGRR